MRISIAMATYNGSEWVEEQLESFAAQTRPPDELVVCDDCSNDDTPDKVASFSERAAFALRLERNSRNLTSTPNFAKAVSLCTGDVIFLSDQDDVWHPEKLEVMTQALEARPQLGAVFSNGRVVDGKLRPMGHSLWDALDFGASERNAVRSGRAVGVFLRHVVAAGCTLAFRAEYRDLYWPLPDLHDSHDAWISFLVASVAPVALVERELLDYRVHGRNQFGLHELSLTEQIEKARWQLESGVFDYGVRFFTQVQERLKASERTIDASLMEAVSAKIEHCRVRNEMSERLTKRLPAIAGELARGNYWRFSYGLRSLAQDLLLR